MVENKLMNEDHHEGEHHTHGAIDATILTTDRGLWTVKWSFIGMFLTALLELIVVFFTGSISLLADSLHNFGDAATAIPLGAAFLLSKKKPTSQFTYGLGRAEDLAGLAIIAIIAVSTAIALYESINRFFHPIAVHNLWAVMIASIIGFIGNEAVATFRIKEGKKMGSAALVADGHHARADGFVSLAVFAGAVGVMLGFPFADPLVGILIIIPIGKMLWESSKTVMIRTLDGVDTDYMHEVKEAVEHCPQVESVSDVKLRWLGHKMHAEVSVAVNSSLSVEQGHTIGSEVRHQLLHHLKYLADATIHVDPSNASGSEFHRIREHSHGNFAIHSH